MFAELRHLWKDFKASAPGHRFQNVYKQRVAKNDKGDLWKKWALITVGTLLTFAGIFLLAAPGPGLLVALVGLALIAGESLTMARFLDWLELKLRPLYLWAHKRWATMSPKMRMTVIALLILLGISAGVFAWFQFMR